MIAASYMVRATSNYRAMVRATRSGPRRTIAACLPVTASAAEKSWDAR
jgi:hypothetical protein